MALPDCRSYFSKPFFGLFELYLEKNTAINKSTIPKAMLYAILSSHNPAAA
jgi:hypothetical protein